MTRSPPFLLQRYESPHDLLLDLLQQHGVPIQELPLAPIAAQYLEYFHAAQEHDFRLDIEWLHMAATLIQWKSKALLPGDPELEARQPNLRAELVEQLRKHARAAAEALRDSLLIGQATFSRPAMEASREDELSDAEHHDPFFSLFDLIRLFEDMERQARAIAEAKKQPPYEVATAEVTVATMMAWFQEKLIEDPGDMLDVTALLYQQETPDRRNSLFLAVLETARNLQIRLDQADVFLPIYCQRSRDVALSPEYEAT